METHINVFDQPMRLKYEIRFRKSSVPYLIFFLHSNDDDDDDESLIYNDRKWNVFVTGEFTSDGVRFKDGFHSIHLKKYETNRYFDGDECDERAILFEAERAVEEFVKTISHGDLLKAVAVEAVVELEANLKAVRKLCQGTSDVDECDLERLKMLDDVQRAIDVQS